MSSPDMLYLPHQHMGPSMSGPGLLAYPITRQARRIPVSTHCTYPITTWAPMSTPDTLTYPITTWAP